MSFSSHFPAFRGGVFSAGRSALPFASRAQLALSQASHHFPAPQGPNCGPSETLGDDSGWLFGLGSRGNEPRKIPWPKAARKDFVLFLRDSWQRLGQAQAVLLTMADRMGYAWHCMGKRFPLSSQSRQALLIRMPSEMRGDTPNPFCFPP